MRGGRLPYTGDLPCRPRSVAGRVTDACGPAVGQEAEASAAGVYLAPGGTPLSFVASRTRLR